MELITKNTSELTVDDIAKYCNRAGITIENLCIKLHELLKATREIKDRYGVVIDNVSDNNVQLKALSIALELLRLINNKDIKVSGTIEHKTVPVEDIVRIENIFIEEIRLRKELNKSRIQQGNNNNNISADDGIIIDAAYTAIRE